MLRELTTERKSIRDAMGFCLDHSENSAQIVYIISEALKIQGTPLIKKAARFFLINDILYNSSLLTVPAAWSYRKYFEAKLPEIIDQLNQDYLDSNDSQSDAAKEKITKVLKVWHDWSIYDQRYLAGLNSVFNRRKMHFGVDPLEFREDSPTNFIKDNSESSFTLRAFEDTLNHLTPSELDKFCKSYGINTKTSRREMIEKSLILKEYEIRHGKELQIEVVVQSSSASKQKRISVTVDLIQNYNKLLNNKQPLNHTLQEIEQHLSEGLEILKFLERRNESLNEKDDDGEGLDDLDYAMYDLVKDEELASGNSSYLSYFRHQ